MPRGAAICAEVAGPPSPEKPNVARAGDGRDDAVRSHPPDAVVAGIREHHAAVRKQRDAVDEVELGGGRGTAVTGETGQRPSRRTVVMRPSLPTRATEGKNGSAKTKPPPGVTAIPRGWSIAALVAGPTVTVLPIDAVAGDSGDRRRRRCGLRGRRQARNEREHEGGRGDQPSSHRLRALNTRWEANRPMRRVSSVEKPASATAARNSCSLRGGRSSGAGRPTGTTRLAALTAG